VAEVDRQLKQVTDERAQIWNTFAQARVMGDELTQLSSRIAACPARNIEPLTTAKTAPEELSAALRLVRQSLEKTAGIAKAIHDKQAEIQRLKHRDKMVVIGMVVSAVVLLLIVWSRF
jgi:hypothetical protein